MLKLQIKFFIEVITPLLWKIKDKRIANIVGSSIDY